MPSGTRTRQFRGFTFKERFIGGTSATKLCDSAKRRWRALWGRRALKVGVDLRRRQAGDARLSEKPGFSKEAGFFVPALFAIRGRYRRFVLVAFGHRLQLFER